MLHSLTQFYSALPHWLPLDLDITLTICLSFICLILVCINNLAPFFSIFHSGSFVFVCILLRSMIHSFTPWMWPLVIQTSSLLHVYSYVFSYVFFVVYRLFQSDYLLSIVSVMLADVPSSFIKFLRTFWTLRLPMSVLQSILDYFSFSFRNSILDCGVPKSKYFDLPAFALQCLENNICKYILIPTALVIPEN